MSAVIIRKSDGKGVMELMNPDHIKTVEKVLNRSKYEMVDILEYLQGINKRS